jgi:hypothetical protein
LRTVADLLIGLARPGRRRGKEDDEDENEKEDDEEEEEEDERTVAPFNQLATTAYSCLPHTVPMES